MQNFYDIIVKIFWSDSMDIKFELGDLKFVWDSEKAEKNFKKNFSVSTQKNFSTLAEIIFYFLQKNFQL